MSDAADTQRTLGRIEGKLDALANFMTAHATQDEVRFSKVEKKLEDLQQNRWYTSGRQSAIAAGISAFMSIAVLWFKGH